MPQTKVRRPLSFPLLAFAGCVLWGCRTTVPAVAPPTSAVDPATRFAGLSDEALVRANQKDGLGLGLRATGFRFKPDQMIPLRVLAEDFGARVPLAGGLCEGLTLRYADATSQQGSTSNVNTPHCIDQVPNPDEIPLVPGHLKVLELTQDNAAHMSIPPGTYDLTVTWAAPPAGKGRIVASEPYTNVTSNPVRVTIAN